MSLDNYTRNWLIAIGILIVGYFLVRLIFPLFNQTTYYSEVLEQTLTIPQDWEIYDGQDTYNLGKGWSYSDNEYVNEFTAVGEFSWFDKRNALFRIERLPICDQNCSSLEELLEVSMQQIEEEEGNGPYFYMEQTSGLSVQAHEVCEIVTLDIRYRPLAYSLIDIDESIYAMDCDGHRYLMNARIFDGDLVEIQRIGLNAISSFE